MAIWRSRRFFIMLSVLIPIVAAGGFALFCHWRVQKVGKTYNYHHVGAVPERSVALVLGTSDRLASGRPNLFFTYRMDAAAALYREGKVRHFLVSGDNRHASYDEPTAMQRALIERGVPETAITLDYAGFRTLDSVIRAKEVFGLDAFTIVSQSFHNQRALLIARHAGIDAVGYAAKDLSAKATLKVRAREVLARIRVIFDLHLLGTRPHFTGPPEPINLASIGSDPTDQP